MKTLSIVVPVYNEEKTVAQVLEKLLALKIPGWKKEIIVVNDGSTDTSESKIRQFGSEIIYLTQPNQGKGAAVRKALKTATGDAVIPQDADLEYNPEDIVKLIKVFDQGFKAVYGSRNIHPRRHGYVHYQWGGKLLTSLINLLYGSKLTDAYTCYKLYDAAILKQAESNASGFEAETEITCLLLRRGIEIIEVPIDYQPRGFAEGKKINSLDGLKVALTILRTRIS